MSFAPFRGYRGPNAFHPGKESGGDRSSIRTGLLVRVARHDKMVALVNCMLDLHKRLATATIPADKRLYQWQIEATDRQIDGSVYEEKG